MLTKAKRYRLLDLCLVEGDMTIWLECLTARVKRFVDFSFVSARKLNDQFLSSVYILASIIILLTSAFITQV